MKEKPFCVGDVSIGRIVSRHSTLQEADKATEANPRDLMRFHESHKESLGMREGDERSHHDDFVDEMT